MTTLAELIEKRLSTQVDADIDEHLVAIASESFVLEAEKLPIASQADAIAACDLIRAEAYGGSREVIMTMAIALTQYLRGLTVKPGELDSGC